MSQLKLQVPPAPAKARQPVRRPIAEVELLSAKLERAIRRGTGDRVRNLRVEVYDNSVAVHGRCGSFYCKQQAGQAAISVMKVEPALCKAIVENLIEVR